MQLLFIFNAGQITVGSSVLGIRQCMYILIIAVQRTLIYPFHHIKYVYIYISSLRHLNINIDTSTNYTYLTAVPIFFPPALHLYLTPAIYSLLTYLNPTFIRQYLLYVYAVVIYIYIHS